MADLTTLLSTFLQGLYAGTSTIAFASGLVGTPSVAIGAANTGFFSGGAGQINVTASGSGAGVFSAGNWTAPTVLYLGSGQDANVSRQAAGVLQVGTTVANALGTIDATSYKAAGTAGVATFGPAGVTSITVKAGLITAIS